MKKKYAVDLDELDVIEVGIQEDGGDYELLCCVDSHGQTGFFEKSDVYETEADALSACEMYCRNKSALYKEKADKIADRAENLGNETC